LAGHEEKKSLRRPRCKYDDNIKRSMMGEQALGMEKNIYFGFQEMRLIFLLEDCFLVPDEGLRSSELINCFLFL
jgi:hypothetical protein